MKFPDVIVMQGNHRDGDYIAGGDCCAVREREILQRFT